MSGSPFKDVLSATIVAWTHSPLRACRSSPRCRSVSIRPCTCRRPARRRASKVPSAAACSPACTRSATHSARRAPECMPPVWLDQCRTPGEAWRARNIACPPEWSSRIDRACGMPQSAIVDQAPARPARLRLRRSLAVAAAPTSGAPTYSPATSDMAAMPYASTDPSEAGSACVATWSE